MGKRTKENSHQVRLRNLTKRLKWQTAGITVEHRNSWGDEIRCNMTHRNLAEAMAMPRSWLVVITLYWRAPDTDYKDDYKYEFQSCTLSDDKSIQKFEAIRDFILTAEKSKGNQNQYLDWGWFATPWESRAKYAQDDEILIANFVKE